MSMSAVFDSTQPHPQPRNDQGYESAKDTCLSRRYSSTQQDYCCQESYIREKLPGGQCGSWEFASGRILGPKRGMQLRIYICHVNSSQALQNAFSNRLSPLGFNLFKMLLPDLMHEVELGIWRAIFIHLLRILQSVGADRLVELDRR